MNLSFTLLRRSKFAILFMAMWLFTSQLMAQTTVYQGISLGSWFDAANWSNGLPAVGNEALIPGGASVLIDQNLTADYAINSFGTVTIGAAVTATFNQPFSTPNLVNIGSIVAVGNLTVQTSLNNSGGTILNKGLMSVQGPFFNVGGSTTNEGTLNIFNTVSSSGVFLNKGNVSNNGVWTNDVSGTFTVAAGATFNNEFGSAMSVPAGYTAQINGTYNNSGTVTCSGNWNVTGTTRNNTSFTFSNAAILTVSTAAQFQNFGTTTVENTATANVAPGATFLVSAGATLVNKATFNNGGNFDLSGAIDNQAGVFTNQAGATINGQFGTTLKNSTTFNNVGSIVTNGTIENMLGATYTNTGSINAGVGAVLTNNGTFLNNGPLNHTNKVINNGTLTNTAAIQILSGGQLINNATLTNAITGRINSQFELINNAGATVTNNGNITVDVRLINSGTVNNNAYLLIQGRLNNLTGGVINNFDLYEQLNGALDNSGTINNSARVVISTCSEVQNRSNATVANTGSIRNRGIFFQKGTLTGNAIINENGYIHTGVNSTAPLCNNVDVGLNDMAEAKVYAQSFISIAAIDSCANFVYTANGVDRPVFTCANRNQTVSINVSVITPTGDSLTCVAQATILDQLAPEFVGCPGDQFIQTTSANAVATWTAPTFTDNCTTPVVVTLDKQSGTSFPVGITGVTYLGKDASNNTNACQFKITVQQVAGASNCTGDNAAPVFVGCPANITLSQTGAKTPVFWTVPTATDACYPLSVITNFNPGFKFGTGATTVNYVATDGNNLKATCSFVVTVNEVNPCTADVQAPTLISCPTNVYLPANINTNTAVATWVPPVFGDLCPFNVTSNQVPGIILQAGVTPVTYTATDASGNVSTCSFLATVGPDPCPGDVTGPIFSACPGHVAVNTTTLSGVATWTVPTATDNCGGVVVNGNYKPGATFPAGETTISYTASDAKGNTSLCTYKVVVTNSCVNESVVPVIANCPATQNITTTPPAITKVATWVAPTATDNCSPVTLTTSNQPGAAFPLGQTTITYIAADQSGNTANCTFTINVTVGTTPGNACNRVIEGLIALYDFKEGSGHTVMDKSNFGTPLNLQIENPGAVSWLPNNCGLKINSSTIIRSTQTGGKIVTALKASKAITIEAWVKPSNLTQAGPARIASLSTDTGNRNFMLAQNGNNYTARLRTNSTDLNGNPTINVTTGSNTTKLDHVVFTHQANGQEFMYVNGALVFSGTRAGDNFSNFDHNYKFALGNEMTMDRAWLGEIYLVAIYDQAFTAAKVTQNYNVGNCCNVTTGGQCQTGGITREYFANVTVENLDLLNTTTPTTVTTLTSFEAPSNVADNYQSRIKGYIRPSVSGAYTFYVTGDDYTVLYLSTNNTEASKVHIANVSGWTTSNDLFKYASQKSATIQLVAGQDYYVQVDHKEWVGGDNVAVFWVTPNNSTPTIIPGANLVAFGGNCTTPATQCPTGGLTRDYYANEFGWDQNIIFNNWGTPTSTSQLSNSQGPTNIGDNYKTRVRGHLRPTTTGVYTFQVTGDDYTWLYLSTDNTAANKTRIAFHNGWTLNQEFNKYASQQSVSITLQAGKDYYLELNHKEGGGGDNFAIFWKTPTNANWTIIEGGNLVPFAGCDVTTTPPQPTCQTGGVVREYFANDFSDNFTTFGTPTSTNLLTTFQGPVNIADNYRTRVRGYVRAAVSGNYTFNVVGDDKTDLYLGTSKEPSSRAIIASVTGWTFVGEQHKYGSQTSAQIYLTAGQDYYIELNHKEWGGGDHFAVYWKTPTNNTFQIIPAASLVPFNCVFPAALVSQVASLQMEATQEFRKARIEWTNNTGPDNDIFLIEKLDEITGEFTIIEAVEAYSLATTTQHFTTYDKQPANGDNFYRVRLIKANGEEMVSDVRKLMFGELDDVNVFPNPSREDFWIDLSKYKDIQVDITVYNMLGMPILTRSIITTDEAILLPMGTMPNGAYQISIQAEGRRAISKSVILQR